ncbi:MBL fold metallo-hydrolase [Halorientalis sp. IM1011]|uniref:MBL fold metallo-hydrolase n=1 Tax=Halorientalis sp. IM1011 TaxID=1932360 RepID=UPI00097CCC14|nr:MBL fold metallo-hydrolase [Halorientalis sp. IM1011]AQL41474.1 MBL fold metallo-hydrolase [Halorientalis sp. IM1011]
MRVTFLGTGSAMPTGERFQTGILLEAAGDRLLIDCGSGVLHALATTEAGYEGIDTVLLTHHHLDHVADLLPLMKARWLAGEESLEIVGPPGTPDLVDDLLSVHEYMQDRIDLTLRGVGADTDESFDVAGFTGEAMETRHSLPCNAYRLSHSADGDGETDPPVFGFSGDSEAFPELVTFFDGAAVLAHDCSFPDDVDVSNHPTPDSLGEAFATADADIGRVYLTHLYPHTEGHHEEMLDSVAERYDGDVRFARDGLSFEIR